MVWRERPEFQSRRKTVIVKIEIDEDCSLEQVILKAECLGIPPSNLLFDFNYRVDSDGDVYGIEHCFSVTRVETNEEYMKRYQNFLVELFEYSKWYDKNKDNILKRDFLINQLETVKKDILAAEKTMVEITREIHLLKEN